MGGLFTALSLRESGIFNAIDVYEQTRTPSTAGAGLNIAPNGARLCKWLGIDLDGGDPKGPAGAIDGGRASILTATRQVLPDNTTRGEADRSQHVSWRRRRLPSHAPPRSVDVPVQASLRAAVLTLACRSRFACTCTNG